MWYKYSLLKVAGTKEEYLQSIGIDNNIITFILQQHDEKLINKLIACIRQNPTASITDLQDIVNKHKIPSGPTKVELAIVDRYKNVPQFYNWVLFQLKKCRRPDNSYNFPVDNIRNELGLIYDWYDRNHINNFTYSLDAAILRERRWHDAMQELSIDDYKPTNPENIVYGPKWKNPDFDGWTIQKVDDKNDLKCEGNKMDHCVGEYYDNVLTGYFIVFSLRDPQNNPHITIGMEPDNTVIQYQGVGNSYPKPLYQEMIKEWFLSLGNVKNESNIETQTLDTIEDTEQILKNRIQNFSPIYDQYGFYIGEDYPIIDYASIMWMLQQYIDKREGTYYSEINYELANLASLVLKLSYLFSSDQRKNNLKEYAFYHLINACYDDIQKSSEQFFNYYDPYYAEELTEEEQEQLMNAEERKFIEQSAESAFAIRVIDEFNKNKEYQDIYKKLYKQAELYKRLHEQHKIYDEELTEEENMKNVGIDI